MQDFRIGLRVLVKERAFCALAVTVLALGICGVTTMFSVVNGVLLRPLPYEQSDRLVMVWGRFDPESGFDFPQFVLSNPEYLDYRDHSKALEDVAAFSGRSLKLELIAPMASNRTESVQSSSSVPPAKTVSCLPMAICS